MKRKGLSLLLIVGLVMVFAGVSVANVPAPPVNQIAGFDDTEFNALTAADCLECHTNVPDAHHLLYGEDMVGPGACQAVTGTCSVALTDCVVDDDCPVGETCVPNDDTCYINDDCTTYTNICTRGEPCGTCSVSGDECGVDDDCPVGETCIDGCPSYHGVQGQCGQPVCVGGSMAPNNPNPNVYGCLTCHTETNVGGVIGFEVERDCMVCHEYRGGATVHHVDATVTGARAGICTTCHGDLVDNLVGCDPVSAVGNCSDTNVVCVEDADCTFPATCVPATCDHEIPTYNPSLVTPKPAGGEEGDCDFCHAEGLDTASGVEVHNQHDTHHHAGGTTFGECNWCHQDGRPGNGPEETEIRTCENCHGYESLHNVQVDSPNAGNIGTIVVGGEDAGWGHVGADDPTGDSDCWGCHGFTIASAPGTGPIVPTIADASVTTITAGAENTITLTGNAFTNDAYTSVVEIAGIDVTPSAISVSSLTATIPALDAGKYQIRVKKAGVVSNPIGISCIPAVAIDSVDCTDGVLTITGSGFGDEAPASAAEFINVKLGADTAEILSWSDTEITVTGCGDAVTVNALYGSASTGATACDGNFDGDEDVDGTDAAAFKGDFGRSAVNNACAAGNLCNGDFDCDGDVDGTDAAGIKADFGRNAFNNACTPEVAADCSY